MSAQDRLGKVADGPDPSQEPPITGSERRVRIACDIGGTFTDVVVSETPGDTVMGKALTHRERLIDGLLAALERAAGELGVALDSLLHRTDLFIFSTTHATNAILEGTTAKTALLCTEGFPDILVRREGGSLRPYDYTRAFADPYVPRHLTFEIPERVDVDGTVLMALDEDLARERLREARSFGVEAVAVCLLWSTANPEHEQRLGRLVEEELPGARCSLSHEVNPIVREYRRASGTSIDASLKPLMQRHLREIAAGLRERGFSGQLLAASSAGGVVPIGELVDRPLWAVRSGPSLAPVGARRIASAETGSGEVIVCDTGGTSFDVSLIRSGELVFTRETWLGEPFCGHLTGVSSVDVRSIGAGGGSIAWVDQGGLLRVGPQSAGADPGPACYGRGGVRPTVTDAALVLGYIDPDYFLGGRMRLDADAAARVLRELGSSLGIESRAAAHAVLAVANERMISAIHELTVNEGVDPRESLLVAGGGAAGLTIVPIARELGCTEIVIPRAAGVLSAFGGQQSDIVREVTAPHFSDSDSFDFAGVRDVLETLRGRMREFTRSLPEELAGAAQAQWSAEARYAHQVWEITIPLAGGDLADDVALERFVEDFHDSHERIFAVREPGQRIEMSQWKGRLVIDTEKPALASRTRHAALRSEEASRPNGCVPGVRRRAFFAEEGEIEVPVHRGEQLSPGDCAQGPALLIEPETTIVLYPGSVAHVTELGNYLVEVNP